MKKNELKKDKVYLIMLDDIFSKNIDNTDEGYGKWRYTYDPILKKGVKEKYKSAIDFTKACTLIKYVEDDTFVEVYTDGEYKIHISYPDYYETGKHLFLAIDDIKEIDDLEQNIFYELGRQNPTAIYGYIKSLHDISKKDSEEKIKKQFDIDYTSAIGENLYFDFVRKRTRE